MKLRKIVSYALAATFLCHIIYILLIIFGYSPFIKSLLAALDSRIVTFCFVIVYVVLIIISIISSEGAKVDKGFELFY